MERILRRNRVFSATALPNRGQDKLLPSCATRRKLKKLNSSMASRRWFAGIFNRESRRARVVSRRAPHIVIMNFKKVVIGGVAYYKASDVDKYFESKEENKEIVSGIFGMIRSMNRKQEKLVDRLFEQTSRRG